MSYELSASCMMTTETMLGRTYLQLILSL